MVNTYYPNWWSTLPKGDGNPFGRLESWAYNRTGTTLTKGKIYQFDHNWTLSATTEPVNSEGLTLPPVANWKTDHLASAWRSLVKCPSQSAAQYGWTVLALENTLDNEKAKILIQGEGTLVGVLGTDNQLVPAGTMLYTNYNADALIGITPIWNTASKVERKIAFSLAATQYADVASAADPLLSRNIDVFFSAWGVHAS